ncbi:uncharacterized protein LOC127251966 isoform X2 [Andrographis paniculata]|uniref:uncharacterized protein LOC127251966 isoform X2 n=1 Tax=Andrographis paniculata TaxID=175694 RepID=UPI0021E6DFD6|nr:uncharacterized protein LOC127251966 isoform X2 [Andrographis paniculata]
MLDGILGRGFTVKCKSLIKTTRARMEVVRKRAEAKQRFLKEDLGKLLSNGLDINAYGRTDEYIAGMNILSCYDYLDQSCEYILKQLSTMQKLEECPEECKEVIASLMYAAARFSDLPELRDLRDTFQERYGSGLETFVNQKFVEKVSSRPATSEKKVRVLQNIASEFSINWDSKGFEKRIVGPAVVAQAEVHKADMAKQKQGLVEKSKARSYGEGNARRRDDGDHHMAGRRDANGDRENSLLKRGGNSSQSENEAPYHGRQYKHSYPVENGDREMKAEISSHSSHGKMQDNGHGADTRLSNGVRNPKKWEDKDELFYGRAGFASSFGEHQGKSENEAPYDEPFGHDNRRSSSKNNHENGSTRSKTLSDCPLPPPYVKQKDKAARPPYSKPKEDEQGNSKASGYGDLDSNGHLFDPASSGGSRKGYRHEDLDYQEEQIPLPKPRSLRRKNHKSSSSYDTEDTPEDLSAANTSSGKRRDHSRKGLQGLFNEDHHRKDDEERMIDKLLLHYSKKPSSYEPGKSRKKVPDQQPPFTKIPDEASGPSMDRSRDTRNKKHEAATAPTRSVSLPPEQTAAAASPEPKKVYNRANSFQGENQAPHVHPKLPDYDDLAARFAALRGR